MISTTLAGPEGKPNNVITWSRLPTPDPENHQNTRNITIQPRSQYSNTKWGSKKPKQIII
jgi:hypothetical protein